MTLHEYPDIEQGSDEWHALRRGIVTASVVGQLVTRSTVKPASNDHSRALTATLVSERITGWTETTYATWEMERGNEDEPRARDHYSLHYAPVTESGFMIRDDWGFKIGFSPDGLVGADGLIEAKSRAPKKHLQTILSDEVPLENMAQIQCGLLVSSRDWCDYLSYCGGMPMWRIRVLPEKRWAEAIFLAVEAFETTAGQMVDQYNAVTAGLPSTERVPYLSDVELKLV